MRKTPIFYTLLSWLNWLILNTPKADSIIKTINKIITGLRENNSNFIPEYFELLSFNSNNPPLPFNTKMIIILEIAGPIDPIEC